MSVAEGGGGDYDDRAVSDFGVSSLSCMTVNTMTRVSLIPRHDPCGNLLVQLQIWVIRGNNIAGDILQPNWYKQVKKPPPHYLTGGLYP